VNNYYTTYGDPYPSYNPIIISHNQPTVYKSSTSSRKKSDEDDSNSNLPVIVGVAIGGAVILCGTYLAAHDTYIKSYRLGLNQDISNIKSQLLSINDGSNNLLSSNLVKCEKAINVYNNQRFRKTLGKAALLGSGLVVGVGVAVASSPVLLSGVCCGIASASYSLWNYITQDDSKDKRVILKLVDTLEESVKSAKSIDQPFLFLQNNDFPTLNPTNVQPLPSFVNNYHSQPNGFIINEYTVNYPDSNSSSPYTTNTQFSDSLNSPVLSPQNTNFSPYGSQTFDSRPNNLYPTAPSFQ
jgi:hypothetical protein